MLNNAIENLKALLPEMGTEELARLDDIVAGRFTVYLAQSFLVAYRTTPELGEACEAVVKAMEPYEALLRFEHDYRLVKTGLVKGTEGSEAEAKQALYDALNALDLDRLKEYGEYRKGAA